mmetsp:Transcript_45613/g.145247  ORF Transcript_45613/g.145247 Transcript_45613/m.145247 type:complete len:207 (-) Transcript_45613:1621-2241(-)
MQRSSAVVFLASSASRAPPRYPVAPVTSTHWAVWSTGGWRVLTATTLAVSSSPSTESASITCTKGKGSSPKGGISPPSTGLGLSPLATASAVGSSRNALIGTFTPKILARRAVSREAASECPPSSKNESELSEVPGSKLSSSSIALSTTATTSPSSASWAMVKSSGRPFPRGRGAGGAGRRLRSTLFIGGGIIGISSSTTYTHGTM